MGAGEEIDHEFEDMVEHAVGDETEEAADAAAEEQMNEEVNRLAREREEARLRKEAANKAKKDVAEDIEKKYGKGGVGKAIAAVATVLVGVFEILGFSAGLISTLAGILGELAAGAIALSVPIIIAILYLIYEFLLKPLWLKVSGQDNISETIPENIPDYPDIVMAESVNDNQVVVKGENPNMRDNARIIYDNSKMRGRQSLINTGNWLKSFVYTKTFLISMIVLAAISFYVLYSKTSSADDLLRDQLAVALESGKYLDKNSLSSVSGGLDKDSSTEETCKNLNSNDINICDQNKCGLNKDGTSCTSCKKLLISSEKEEKEDKNEDKVEKYALYGYLIFKGSSKLDKKIFNGYIRNRLVSCVKFVGTKFMEMIEETLYKAAASVAKRMGEEAAARGAEMASELAAEAAVMATGVGLVLGPVFAVIDIVQMVGMALDLIDISDFRTYISNPQNVLQRNQLDAGYLKLIVNGHSIVNPQGIPDIKDQFPSMYQLDTMVNPLMNSKIPEASILLKIGLCYSEARIAWMIKMLNLTSDDIKNNYKDQNLYNYHDEIVKIYKRGIAAGYGEGSPSPSSNNIPDLDIKSFEYINPNNEEKLDSNYKYRGGYCQYEIEFYQAIDNFVNYEHEERDKFYFDYTKKFMKDYAPNDQAVDSILNSTSLVTEDIWGDDLPGECSNIINTWKKNNGSSDYNSTYSGSDLIKNYGNGNIHLSGISLTEEGCLLLNQILDYESYMYPIRNENDSIVPMKTAYETQKLSLVQLPKVVFSENYRVLVKSGENKDNIISVKNKDGIKLPQYYPSTATIEMKCKYGYEAMKAGLPDKLTSVDDYELSAGLSFMAKGDGSEEWTNWLPLLFGVTFDENMGVCKYDGKNYCVRMGRQPKKKVYENTGTNKGLQYESCDETELGPLADWGVGETICREANRFLNWHC